MNIKNKQKPSEYNVKKYAWSSTMCNCTNLYFLSTIACQLSECMGNEELEKLKADLLVLGYMLENIQTTSNTTCPVHNKCDIFTIY